MLKQKQLQSVAHYIMDPAVSGFGFLTPLRTGQEVIRNRTRLRFCANYQAANKKYGAEGAKGEPWLISRPFEGYT